MSRSFRPHLEASMPSRAPSFDPWNSSSTGHQTEKNRLSGSKAWQENRTIKLGAQFSDGERRGGVRLPDKVGAGACTEDNSGRIGTGKRKDSRRLQESSPRDHASGRGALVHFVSHKDNGKPLIQLPLKATPGDQSVSYDRASTHIDETYECSPTSHEQIAKSDLRSSEETPNEAYLDCPTSAQPKTSSPTNPRNSSNGHEKLFANLTFYINASTYPAISDHKLKQLLVFHGGSLALGLSRKRVTHVILGNKTTGGSLAARKLQREIAGSKSNVKLVTVDWVLQSIRDGRRLPERLFQPTSLVSTSQKKLRIPEASANLAMKD